MTSDHESPRSPATPRSLWRALTTGRLRLHVRGLDLAELVRGTVQGSREHHGELCRRVHDQLLPFARHLTRDDDEAKDLLQDVYAALPRSLAGYDERGQLHAWLTRVVFNRWRTRARARSLREQREEPLDDEAGFATTGQSITAEVALRDLVDRALRGMPSAPREAWALFSAGVPPDEIARRLDISYDAANTRLSRARRYLKRQLTDLT